MNIYGAGPYSSEVAIMAAGVPSKIIAIKSEIVNTDVKLSWTRAADNESPITAFTILIERKDGEFREDSTYCDGSSTFVLANDYCLVPMSILIAAPNSLVKDDFIRFKISSTN